MSKIIKCLACNEDIAANAKICPKCGAKNKKPIYKRWWVWVIAVVLIAAISSGGEEKAVKTESKETIANIETKADGEKKEREYNIGELIQSNKFEINILSVDTAKSVGSQYLKEEVSEGGIYVVVNWEYKNISDNPVSAFSVPTIRLSDSKGTKYDSDINATSYYATEAQLDSKILSDLNPNIKVKDAEVFEISEESYNQGGFYIVVDADKDFKIKIK